MKKPSLRRSAFNRAFNHTPYISKTKPLSSRASIPVGVARLSAPSEPVSNPKTTSAIAMWHCTTEIHQEPTCDIIKEWDLPTSVVPTTPNQISSLLQKLQQHLNAATPIGHYPHSHVPCVSYGISLGAAYHKCPASTLCEGRSDSLDTICTLMRLARALDVQSMSFAWLPMRQTLSRMKSTPGGAQHRCA
eukprot:5435280-Amphidinium_carterae.1